MNINKNTTFLAFDFETTGLDTKKDEPIQIGIVRANSQFQILDTYTTLIKPKKDIKELKGIVKFITGLSLDQLADAPSMEEILPNIRERFDDDVVVVGHNVSFDIAMMQPFLPEWKPTKLFDTFHWSQRLVHYPASFALEVLWGQITDEYAKDPFVFADGESWDFRDESHHDALYDSFTSLALARHLLQKMESMTEKYPWMDAIVNQHSLLGTLYHSALDAESSTSHKDPGSSQGGQQEGKNSTTLRSSESPATPQSLIQLPILTKPLTNDTKDLEPHTPAVDFRSLPANKTRFSGHIPLEEMLLSAVANKPVIIATHTGQKLEIVKNILHRHGHQDIGFAKPEQHIDYNAFATLLSQEYLTDNIVEFALKYLSHAEQGLRVLQLLKDDERAIFDAIEKTTDRHNKDIILCSHGGLYRIIEQGLYPEHEIVFLDADWRYHSYNRFRSVSFDPYQALASMERVTRSYEIRQQISPDVDYSQTIATLEKATNTCTLFVGTIGMETNAVFSGHGSDTIETGPISTKSEWARTAGSWTGLRECLDDVLTIENLEGRNTVQQLRDHLSAIYDELITIRRGSRDRSYMHYTYQTTHEYSDFSEFMGIFEGRHAVITSHVRTTNQPIVPLENTYLQPHFLTAPTPPQLTREIQNLDPSQSMTFFILSSSKSSSQGLFQKLQSDPHFSSYSLIVDGITGSTAKNTHKAKQPGPTIIIGGYYFYLNLIAKNTPIDHIIIYALGGAMKPLILGDVGYYS